jgi:hypothetical protein
MLKIYSRADEIEIEWFLKAQRVFYTVVVGQSSSKIFPGSG